ncbi:hypothetical protein [Pseudopedobacter sp.]|uniref:hypothetical protein n=1 Tax=Pseudopedobacter sp. TaxID=1936787 RepID=UPI00334179C4
MNNRNVIPILGIYFLLLIIGCKKNLLDISGKETYIDLETSNIPDFSYAGYMMSERPLPVLEDIFTVTVSPDNLSDHTTLLQSKIDELSKRPILDGFRGVLLLKKGKYFVSQPININSSGVVIKGEIDSYGQIPIIHFNKVMNWRNIKEAQDWSIIKIKGLNISDNKIGLPFSIIQDIDQAGSTHISIDKSHSFVKGDSIMIVKTPNDNWITTLNTSQYGWISSEYHVESKRVIKDLKENLITLNIPLYDKIKNNYGGGYVIKYNSSNYIFNCGVENIHFISSYLEGNNEDETHIWSSIILENATNCWVKKVKTENLAFSLVSLINSSFCTIQDCSAINFKSKPIGDRRYPYYIGQFSYGNLIQRCFASSGRHDFSTGARLTGPNVFLDCLSENSLADSGPHHRWAVGTLYDNISSNKIYARNSGEFGSGHGWTGAFNLFWNNRASFGFLIQNPPDAMNWLIGSQGRLLENSIPYTISHGRNVSPRSLFIYQLSKRLGENKVKTIFTDVQLLPENEIWTRINYLR